MIQFEQISKRFGKVEVLKQLDLSIDQNGVFAILGPNGSGKTTLIKALLGMVLPEKGNIMVNGKKVKGEHLYREEISYLPQIANFPGNLTVKELIGMINNLRSSNGNWDELIEQFGLEEYLDKKLSHLSGGTRQKVNLVLTFMFDTELIILDEPTSGLDPLSLVTLKEIIAREKERGKTILITSHIINFVEEMADQIVFLLDGQIYFKGIPDELKKQTEQKNLEHAIAKILATHA